MRTVTLCIIVAAQILVVAIAAAGPPLITDDPETPDQNEWEINVSHQMAEFSSGFAMPCPWFDINYSVTDFDQAKIEVPVMYANSPDTGGNWGMGDVVIGWKHRFGDEEEHKFLVSFFPQLILPTGDATNFLGAGQTLAFLPVQLGKHFQDDKLFVYGEIGYACTLGNPTGQFWKYGLAVVRQVNDKLDLMGEVGGFAFDRTGGDYTFFNLGFKRGLSKDVALICSCGRGLGEYERGAPDLLAFVGLHIHLRGHCGEPHRNRDEEPAGSTASAPSMILPSVR